jgi:hypothetical protein
MVSKKHFYRFISLITDPDPGGQLIKDLSGSGSYLDIFVPNEKQIFCQIVPVAYH